MKESWFEGNSSKLFHKKPYEIRAPESSSQVKPFPKLLEEKGVALQMALAKF